MANCNGKTKTGAACRAPAGAEGLCFLHRNPGRAASLGALGGRKNRRSVIDLDVPDNMTAADIRKVTVQLIRLVLSDELGAREAGAVYPAAKFAAPRDSDRRARSPCGTAGGTT